MIRPTHIIKKVKRFTLYVLLIAVVAIQSSSPAGAEANLLDLIDQGVSYYIPGDSCNSSSTAPISSTLPADFNEAVGKLKATYEAGARATNVPWQVLAGIHYRESNLSTTKDLQAGNPFGGPYKYESTSYAKFGYPKNLEESIINAGKELQDKAQAGIFHKKIDPTAIDAELIKDALFGYNGRAAVYKEQAARLGFNPETQPYEGSPYVMSRFDAIHTGMKIITTDHGPADGIDGRYGAYTVYVALGGPTTGAATPGSDICAGVGVTGEFNTLVKLYAWPEYHDADFVSKMPKYEEAVAAAENKGEYVGGCRGVDCGAFVTILLRNSGVDVTYNNNGKGGPVTEQRAWMESHPEKYRKFKARDSSELMPGDVWINSGSSHTYIFVGQIDGFNSNAASASLCERSPMAQRGGAYDFDEDWFRIIK